MAYQVLARKWRPQDFSSLVGQEPIVTALSNALTEGRIAQAYLFSGIRGVGKTTTARLLAKALNCERGPTGDPCNECPPCREITRGGDLDVIEVDAATYSKVEQVRELTESLRYSPARDRYKVVVIDEIHRLSRQAFDALLKIVEEPPPHLVFIFATTEIEAVPATILSRCQEFRFRRVPTQALADHLRQVSDAESIAVSDTALRLISRAGEGSVRDAVALLDQLATFGSGTIRDEDAARLTGSLDATFFQGVLAAILSGRAGEVSGAVARVEEEGWDPRHVYGQFLTYCRDALHLGMGGQPERVDLPADDAAELGEIARQAGYENLLRLSQQLLGSEETVRRSDAGALAVEIAWLRAAELPKLTRVEEILGGAVAPAASPASGPGGPASPPPAGGRGGARSAPGSGGRRAGGEPAERERSRPRAAAASPEPPSPQADEPPQAKRLSEQPPETAAAPAGEPEELEPGGPAAGNGAAPADEPEPPAPTAPPAAADSPELERFFEEVGLRRSPLQSKLKTFADLEPREGELLIHLHADGEILQKALQRASNRRALEEAVAAVWGDQTGWHLVKSSRPPEEPPEEEEAPGEVEEARQHPAVQAVLNIFGGEVAAVKPHAQGQED